ncbi:unnamed protein product [Prunus armeniaca]
MKYVMDLLADTRMLDCKPADTPIVENHKLGIYVDQVPTKKERYQSEDHMVAVMHILSYLKFAPRRGYFTFVDDNLVTRRSKKQNVVSQSSTGFEYRGIAQGVCEILWLRWLFTEIRFRLDAATKLYCDSQSTFQIAKLISIPFVPSSKQLANMLTHAVSKC